MLHNSISKAAFYIAVKTNNGYKKTGPFKVLFNPAKISIYLDKLNDEVYSKNKKQNIICLARKNPKIDDSNNFYAGINTSSRISLNRSISMELMFDLVESYEYAKFKGKGEFLDNSFKDDSIKSDLAQISVFNESCCCIPKLNDAFENSYPVKFIWGANIEFVGKIDNLTTILLYFSEKGLPLRASVRLTIQENDFSKIF